MYKQGAILTQEEFSALPKEKLFAKGNNLTRIWGAHYLAKEFQKNQRKDIRVPRYILIVDDPGKIDVRLSFLSSCFPIVSEIINGQIYAEKIEGKPVATKSMRTPISEFVGYGYTDYSDPGNILKTKDNIYYVVDTEYKSFYDADPGTYIFKKVKGGALLMCEYFFNRFRLLNNVSFSTDIKISVDPKQ